MFKLKTVFSSLSLSLSLSFFLLALPAFLFAADSVTITTYYPSPYGSYYNLYVSNQLGIGTTGPDPSAKLHVMGATNVGGTNVGTDAERPTIQVEGMYPNLIVKGLGNSSHSATIGLWAFDGTNTQQWNMGVGQNGLFSMGYTTNQSNPHVGINNYVANSVLAMSTTGNVGIGTTSPGNKLDIRGTAATLGINAAQLWLSRTTPATQAQGINFRAGPSADYIVGRLANSDDLVFGPDYGGDVINERVRFTAGGNVGIGTTSPLDKLYIAGDISGVDVLNNDGNDRPGMTVKGAYPEVNLISTTYSNTNHGSTLRFVGYQDANRNSWRHWVIGTSGNATNLDFGYSGNSQSNPHMGIANYDRAWGGTSGDTFMRIASSGNVGIGTTGPDRKLVIQEGTTAEHQLFLKQNNANHGYTLGSSAQDGDLRFARRVDGTVTETVRFTASGNVGIGTTTPGAKLEVVGDFIRTINRSHANGCDDATDDGRLSCRTVNFTKKKSDTGIRLSYVDNFRVYSGGADRTCRWEIRYSTSDPGTNKAATSACNPRLYYDHYQYGITGANTHRMGSVFGTCYSASGAALPAGTYWFTVWVNREPHNISDADCHSGWASQYVALEAEEVR